jgi:ATP-binding cassette subfamily B protein
VFADKAGKVRDLGVRIALLTRIFMAAVLTIPALALALVYGVGGNLAVDGTLTVGTLVALGALLVRLLGPLQSLSNVRIDVMTALVSFERVFEVLDLPSMIEEAPDALTLPAGSASLAFDHVDFTYPRADQISLASLETVARAESRDSGQVLHDISFRAEPGQMIALVGPSGAGKTTVTHLVARLYDAGSGTVSVGGHDVRGVTLQSLEDTVGYVTQDAHMFHDTISKTLDSQDTDNQGSGVAPIQARHLEKGRAAFDRNHRLIGVINWELPFGQGKRFLSGGGGPRCRAAPGCRRRCRSEPDGRCRSRTGG